MKETYGRRNEVALRIKMLGREERVAEALGQWIRRSEEAYSRLSHSGGPEKLRLLVTTMAEEAKSLLASLDTPLVLQIDDGDVEGSASFGRLVTAEYLVEDMKEERAVVGLRRSAVGEAGSVCVVDMNCERAVPGVTRPGEAGDRESGTTSAGFGKVLYVEPREVYPSSYREQYGTFSWRRKAQTCL